MIGMDRCGHERGGVDQTSFVANTFDIEDRAFTFTISKSLPNAAIVLNPSETIFNLALDSILQAVQSQFAIRIAKESNASHCRRGSIAKANVQHCSVESIQS